MARKGAGERAPADVLAEAIARGPMTPEEEALHECRKAAVAHQDDLRRAAPSPQAPLDFPQAA